MLHVVTDFDGTLMHQDVGDTLMRELGVLEEAETMEVTRLFREKKIGSLDWIRTAYTFLEGKREQVDRIIDTVRPREGAAEFLAICREHRIPVTILSDGMSYYVERITAKFGIQVHDIIVNPITYTRDGGYDLKVQNPNPFCKWCGCCKAGVVRELKQAGSHIIYIGDGSSDFFGSGYADWVFARSNLANRMLQGGDRYFPFESFHDILQVLKPQLNAFLDGSAEGKRHIPNTFCKFSG